MESMNILLEKNSSIEQKYNAFLKSIKVLREIENNWSYRKFINEITPLVGGLVETFEREKHFEQGKLMEYIQKYKTFWVEYMKYQVWLIGNAQDCSTVKELLDYNKVHLLGERQDIPADSNEDDYIIICSNMRLEKQTELYKPKLIDYDFLRRCAWRISPESAFLDLKLRQKIDEGIDGVITGLSYEQRGINYHTIKNRLACLSTPSQDLYLDYKSFLWVYDEVVVKRGGRLKYCIIGMDFYRLWYDLSLSPENNVRMLCYYKRLRSMHHCHDFDYTLSKYEEDIRACDELMIENYIDIDYCRNFHPELYYEKEVKDQYFPSEEEYSRDCNEVKKVFDKPYSSTFKENYGIIERYLKFLHMNEIKVLVYIPPFPEIFNRFTSCEMKQKTLNVLQHLKEKYGFEFLDLSCDMRFTGECFADWSHLNTRGANIATEILNNFMDEIWG